MSLYISQNILRVKDKLIYIIGCRGDVNSENNKNRKPLRMNLGGYFLRREYKRENVSEILQLVDIV